MKNEWTVEEYKATTIEENITKKVFVVPRYQRGLVWKEQQRFDLVDTIKKGLPFGTLLLYKTSSGTYQIIDGLQRSNAILEFVKNPTQFFDENDIDINVIKEIVKLANVAGNKNSQEEQVKNLLIDWVKNDHKTLDDVTGMQFSKFGRIVAEQFVTCKGKEFDIGDLIAPMMQSYRDICSTISNTKIPAIVLSGDEELLPLLFERINSKGTQLSKYQIYAATWSNKKYVLSEKFIDIVKANKERYDQMLDGNGTIDGYDPIQFLKERKLDTFEIAFGLGKYLAKTYSHLFGESKEDTQVEGFGFTLMGTCLGMKYTEGNILHSRLDQYIGQESINVFLEKILDAVKLVDKKIGKFSKFKSNARFTGKRPLHSELQIVAIISSVFLMKWAYIDLDEKDNLISISYNFDKVKKEWKKSLEKGFADNVAKRYLSEIFRKKWAGTGNVKLDQILSVPSFYAETITKEEFESSLDVWFNNVKEERAEYVKIAAPKEQELAFLSAIYLTLFTANQQTDESNYDIEHLATQKLMKTHLTRFEGQLRLPISSIGNLCLLPEYANRSKRDKTLYEDDEYLRKLDMTIEEIEERYSFTTKTDLDWIHDMNSTMDEFKDNYMCFIENHFNRMKHILLDNYNNI